MINCTKIAILMQISITNEYVQGTKTVYYLLYKIEGIFTVVYSIDQ